MAVPDAYSAMTTDRPYRKGLSVEEASAELRKGRGTQWDPAIVDSFLRALGDRLKEEAAEAAREQESAPAPALARLVAVRS